MTMLAKRFYTMHDVGTKRIPRVYVAGSHRDQFVNTVKFDMMAAVVEKHGDGMKFLDPVRHSISRDNHDDIVRVNTTDIEQCDLFIALTGDRIGSGTAIEMHIAGSILKKDVLLFTNLNYDNVTPHLRHICKQNVFPLYRATEIIDSWVREWYDR